MGDNKNKNILKFLEFAGRLKHIPRTGWVLENVKKPESIAGHMYRMAVMSFLLDGNDNKLDRAKCMELAVIHDLAECIVGDLTPYCGVTPEEKHKREVKAMEELASLVGSCGGNMIGLFKEYEEQRTPEAQFVKELDRFDLILQAFEYEKEESRPGSLQQFFDSCKGKFSHPLIVGLVKELDSQRSSVVSNDIL
ncbi:5'-deoxynucleotidase HDDC2 [Lycorma delicatula]|uniref:5'-deoxynucleotidase HDDC2 n=1 Tax=Lycorma delicatula TaxID=130591 RepID=UPI003F5178B0